MSLLLIWVLYTAIATGFLSAVFVWAVRSGQFGDQERARSLPLVDGVAPVGAQASRLPEGGPGGADRAAERGERRQ